MLLLGPSHMVLVTVLPAFGEDYDAASCMYHVSQKRSTGWGFEVNSAGKTDKNVNNMNRYLPVDV